MNNGNRDSSSREAIGEKPGIKDPYFYSSRYNDETISHTNKKLQENELNLIDASDSYANFHKAYFEVKNLQLYKNNQHSLNSQTTGLVRFKAYLENLKDTHKPDWKQEQVFGRADPLFMYSSTTRIIDIGLKMPASTISEARDNLLKINYMKNWLYPFYSDGSGNASTITQGTLLRIKFMNLIHKEGDMNEGLLCIPNSINADYDLNKSQVFIDNGYSYPQLITLSMTFNVIHEQHLGFNASNSGLFPDERDGQTLQSFPASIQRNSGQYREQGTVTQKTVKNNFSQQRDRQRQQEEEKVASQQALDNAKARYSGMFGKTRFERDYKKITEKPNNNEYLRDTVEAVDYFKDFIE